VLRVGGRRYLAAPAETGLSAGVPQESGQALTYFVENAADFYDTRNKRLTYMWNA